MSTLNIMVDKTSTIGSAFSSAINGIKNAYKSISDTTQRISSGESIQKGTFVEDAVNIKIDSLTIKANSKVISIVNNTEKSVLDILDDKNK